MNSRDRQRRGSSVLALLGRHQLASLAATVVDFGAMTALVELFGRSPVVATLVGAALGAATNFTLGRSFTFRVGGALAPQAARYAMVSTASAGLNALGEYVAHDRLGLQYLFARVVVALTVSVAWNFPLQRYFVFSNRDAKP